MLLYAFFFAAGAALGAGLTYRFTRPRPRYRLPEGFEPRWVQQTWSGELLKDSQRESQRPLPNGIDEQ